jgi:hypothetical protein
MCGMGCALSIHQKEYRKSLGCALYIGARYLPENTVICAQRDGTRKNKKKVWKISAAV